MSEDFELMGLFPIPLIKIKFKYHDKYNFPEVEKKENKPDEWNCSLNTSFPAIFDTDSIVSPTVRDSFIKDLLECVKEVIGKLNMPTNIGISQLWYNIYHDNQGQEPHHHLPMVGGTLPFWCGIYYNKNASPTTFHRSDRLYQTQLFTGYPESAMNGILGLHCSPPVEDGDILLFPPHLEHSVQSKPENKNKMRMTFSFNIGIEK